MHKIKHSHLLLVEKCYLAIVIHVTLERLQYVEIIAGSSQ